MPTLAKHFDMAAAVQAVADQPARELTLAELVRGYSIETLDGTEQRLRKWIEAFGDLSAWALTGDNLQVAALAMERHGYARSTINRDLSALGSVYRWAQAKRIAPRGFRRPTLEVQRYKEPIRRVHVEPEKIEQIRELSLTYSSRRFGVFVALLIDTGARKSELLERHGRDFDLDRCEVFAPTTKNGTPRVLFFREQTATLIRRVYPKMKPDALMFQGRVPGQPVSYRKAWEWVTTAVGLPDLHMHDIRHVKAASLLRSGTPLSVAAQIMGHSSNILTHRYGHLETETLRAAQHQSWQQAA